MEQQNQLNHEQPNLSPLEQQHTRPPREYASVLTRFGAIVIDVLVLLPFYVPISVFGKAIDEGGDPSTSSAIILILVAIGMAVFGIWNTIVRLGRTGQSLGRKFLNIAVLTSDGRPIGVGRAALREIIGRWLSGLICYIGYLNAFWDRDRQMWHDKLASCYVYYVEENFS